MLSTRRFTPTRLMLPAVLLAWVPALTGAGYHFENDGKIIRITNSNNEPIEVAEAKAMERTAKWRRNAKGSDAPGQPSRDQAAATPRRMTLDPGGEIKIELSGTRPFLLFDVSNGRQKVQLACDIHSGKPMVVGQADGVGGSAPASLRTEDGQEYRFTFRKARQLEPSLDADIVPVPPVPRRLGPDEKRALKALAEPKPLAPAERAVLKAASDEYRHAVGAPEPHSLADRAARTDPRPWVPAAQENTGRPRLKRPSKAPAFKPMPSLAERPARKAAPVETPTPSAEGVNRNQAMLDFYAGLF